ncbi:NAD(P)H-hydrate dehydratase [Ramlibacter rhizophilus]|uniref:Bifunctional NAD(P)H-hydrate repair enzyme n=1 Tax=Ramlibacter rhizophilus TaxID=1781167 RepID=A0A4Z0BT16_9BURK|nr:NAD(P)H-hydrate dehydratase [Ramlibacter rhizophilus]TFZ01604.1 NAD(P)H-hydrate dehydratase [Ramlibacter rhizophilus]
MQRVTAGPPWALHDIAAIRRIESAAALGLPPHALMQRAGLAVARLALALAPHEPGVWLACGPGNNGGDGLEAAWHLKAWGRSPVVTWLGDEQSVPADARASLERARHAGVVFTDTPPPRCGLAIDALFGLGARRPLAGRAAQCRDALATLAAAGTPVLAVDLPSGLDADTGTGEQPVRADHTLSLLALKPGLFTAQGRDAAGQVWFDDLGVTASEPASAMLSARPEPVLRPHASHKGSWGDVAVVGGAAGLRGAALLAARAALHAGAGRVFVAPLQASGEPTLDPFQPDLMFRDPEALDLPRLHIVCGCGGGDAVRAVLPRIISSARSLVLDADALNAIAADASLGKLLRARSGRADRPSVITPHPLEAARLLQLTAGEVQQDRLSAARKLVEAFGCVVVLKGSGSVIAAPGEVPRINPTGNARLAIAGTGDVLAGMVATRMARGQAPFAAACDAVHAHGELADHWPAGETLTAAALARSIAPD